MPKSIVPIKEYGRVDIRAVERRQIDAGPPDLKSVCTDLVQQNKRLRDKISRLERMIEDELRMWRRGLETGEWENREALRRRMSRLRGAVEYLGNENSWTLVEK